MAFFCSLRQGLAVVLTVVCLAASACAQSSEAEILKLWKQTFLYSPEGPVAKVLDQGKRSWTGTSPCGKKWFGIGCKRGRVQSITLNTAYAGYNGDGTSPIAGAELSVELIPQLAGLKNLIHLRLIGVNLNRTGTIPAAYTSMTNLQTMVLRGAYNSQGGPISEETGEPFPPAGLSGPLPPQLPPALKELDLVNNAFQGQVPKSWVNLASLKRVNLGQNGISGTFLSMAEALPPLLEYLNADNNQVEGPLAPAHKRFLRLQYLLMNDNKLTGTIPSRQWARSLQSLQLSGNSLVGKIPTLSVSRFQAARNALTGNVPRLSRDTYYFDVSQNQLDGTITSFYFTISQPLPMLKFVDVSSNKLKGTLPPLTYSLFELRFSNNQITGTFPASRYNYGDLRVINGSNNKLSGTLPPLSPRFEYVNLEDNNLEGPLPAVSGTSAPAFELQELYLAGNKLSGSLPEGWASLPKLRTVTLNRLPGVSGTVPAAWGQSGAFANLTSMFLKPDNALCGPIPANLNSVAFGFASGDSLSGGTPLNGTLGPC